MSNVIGFLEKMGQDAALRHATRNEMELALARTAIDPELQAAILNSDQARLEAVLGARTNVVCGQATPDDDDAPKHPIPDDDEVIALSVLRRVA